MKILRYARKLFKSVTRSYNQLQGRYFGLRNFLNTLQNLPVSVRVGQSVDVVGKAGNPKSIVGGHVQTTPVLLCMGEKAELVSDQYEPLSSVLEGFVILREKVILR